MVDGDVPAPQSGFPSFGGTMGSRRAAWSSRWVAATQTAVDLTNATSGTMVGSQTFTLTPLPALSVFSLAALAPGMMGSGALQADFYHQRIPRKRWTPAWVSSKMVLEKGYAGLPQLLGRERKSARAHDQQDDSSLASEIRASIISYRQSWSQPGSEFVKSSLSCHARSPRKLPRPLSSPCKAPGLHLNVGHLDVRRPFPSNIEP